MQHVSGYWNSHGTYTRSYTRRSPAARGKSGEVGGGIVALILLLIGVAVFNGDTDTPPDTDSSYSYAGLAYAQQASDIPSSCTSVSYGALRTWLRAHPCRGVVHRHLYTATTAQGQRVMVSTATVDMPTTSAASAFKTITDRPRSGNITELGSGPGGITFTGRHYAASLNGTTVTVAQAEPATTTTHLPASVLDHAAAGGLRVPK